MQQGRFLPYSAPLLEDEEIGEVLDTLRSGWVTRGPKTALFETQFAAYIGAEHAVAVSSCTAALHLALVARGVGPGDEVITTPFTFAATVNVILHTGAKPVFVDIDPQTMNIDPAKIKAKITSNTKAIIPVHFAGQPCDMDPINALARKHDLFVLEDAAHALPASYKGRVIGNSQHAVAFSFYATKNLVTGEGGMLTTNDSTLSDQMRILSLHGMTRNAWNRYTAAGSWRYDILVPGYKYNMTDIQAAMGIHQLRKLTRYQDTRREIVRQYEKGLGDLDALILPHEEPYAQHAWHLYVIRLKPGALSIGRDRFIEELKARGVGTSVHFIPIHLHSWHRENLGLRKEDLPVATDVFEQVVSLPLYPKMTQEDVAFAIEAVRDTVNAYA
ncbi:MAG: DegT/DnrJ/EryC1/StrS family aminotransferase [Bacillota bacterium]